MTHPRPRGVIAATATPVHADFSVDLPRLVAHCRALLDDGCDGINLLGTTGEATAFSVEQRMAVMRGVAESGLPLGRFLVGTGLPALEDTVRLTRTACELGFAGALVLPPFFYPDVPAAGLVGYVGALIERIAHPSLALYLYHIPQNTQVAWPVAVVAELRQRHGATVAGLKDSAGDLAYARSIVAAVADFDVFPSSEAVLARAGAEGYAGCISATANLTSRHAQAAWAGQGTPAGVAAGQKAADLRGIVAKHPLVASVKAGLAARYADPAWARICLPMLTLAAEAAARMQAEFEARAAAA